MDTGEEDANKDQVLAALEAFADGSDEADNALPWAALLSPADQRRLRADLKLLVSEPELYGEPPDWREIEEALKDGAELAEWHGPLVLIESDGKRPSFSVDLRRRDEGALGRAPAAVQHSVERILTEFLPGHPTAGDRLPRGQLKKLCNRDVWQIDLADGYRLRYFVDKAARVVYILYLGAHPAGDPRGRERSLHRDVPSKQHAS